MTAILSLALVLAAGPTLPPPRPAAPLSSLPPDHPAARTCVAQPDKCTCAVTKAVACIDTPAGKPRLAACVRGLLRQYGGRVKLTPAELTKAVNERCRESLGSDECGPPQCLRWAGVNEDFGSEAARNPWFSWQVVERIDEAENTRTVCTFSEGPRSPPCRLSARTSPEQMTRYAFQPISVGYWRAPPSVEVDSGASYGENPLGNKPDRDDEADAPDRGADEDTVDADSPLLQRIVHARGTYVKVGKFIERTKKGWAEGSYTLVPVKNTFGSRTSGPWSFFHHNGTPRMQGVLQPAGPLKQEFRTGTWTFYDGAGRAAQEGEYQVTRDPQEDRFFSAKKGLWRSFTNGGLRRVEHYRDPSPLKFDWKSGERPVSRTFGRFQWVSQLDLDHDGRPFAFSEQAYHEAFGRWLRHGVQVRWGANARVVSLEQRRFDQVMGPSFRFAAESPEDLPWPEGTVEARYDAIALSPRSVPALNSPDESVKAAARAVNPRQEVHTTLEEGWALSTDVSSDVALSINFTRPVGDYGRLASECAHRIPRKNASQRYCQSDSDCVGNESCDAATNTCASTWPEGWRQDQTVPYCQDNWLTQPSDFQGRFYRTVRVARRYDAESEPVLTTCSTRWSGRIENSYGYVSTDVPAHEEKSQLIWARTTPGYGRTDNLAEQVALSPQTPAWEDRACFNLPLVPAEDAEEALQKVPDLVRGKGLDDWLAPVLEARREGEDSAEDPEECTSFDGSADGLSYARSELARGNSWRACVPIITGWTNGAIQRKVNNDIRARWLTGCGDGSYKVHAAVMNASQGLFSVGAVLKHACLGHAPGEYAETLTWDMNTGLPVSFGEAFSPTLTGRPLSLALRTGRKAGELNVSETATKACNALLGSGFFWFYVYSVEDEPTTITIGEKIPSTGSADCSWTVTLPLNTARAFFSPTSPLQRLK